MTIEAKVAIVDYGLGNLFSIQQACHYAGMEAVITASPPEILSSSAVILPGMGAFGDAMDALHRLDLVEPLRDVAASEKPLIGICLGLQLLMSESYEFGCHKGLGIIEGPVVRFDNPVGAKGQLKVPQVGWTRITRPAKGDDAVPWSDSPLEGLRDGEFMYFVHSFYVQPLKPEHVLSMSRYGQIEFCSSLQYHNIFACQFHPERSGPHGLRIYQNIASLVRSQNQIISESVNA